MLYNIIVFFNHHILDNKAGNKNNLFLKYMIKSNFNLGDRVIMTINKYNTHYFPFSGLANNTIYQLINDRTFPHDFFLFYCLIV